MIPPGVAAPLTATRSAPTAVEQHAPVAGGRRDVVVGELLMAAAASGFVESLAATDDAYVVCHCCGQRCDPDDLLVRHLQGVSDRKTAAHLVVACVICPTCTAAGTLVLGTGAEATPGHTDVFRSMLAGRDPLAMT